MPDRLATLAAALALIAAGGCSRDFDLPEAPDLGDGTISGALTVELPGESQPIAAASAVVELLAPDGATIESLVATAEGRFAVKPPAPPWTLLFRHDSDGDGSFDRQRLLASSELPLIPGADYSVGELLIGENAELRGHVRRGDRQNPDDGHDGTSVVLTGSSFPPTTSAADGSFRLRDLPSGTVRILFTREGYSPESRTVQLDPGEAKELVELELVALVDSVGTLTGTAVRDDGAPATVVIEASRSGDLTPAGRLPVTAGEPFTLAPLPAGSYLVTATIVGYGTLQLAAVELAAGEEVDLGTLTVPADDPVIPPPDGAAVVGWEPSPEVVLPALGTIVATLDRGVVVPLTLEGELFSGPQLLELTNEDGALAPNTQELVPAGTLLPDGSTTTTTTVRFTPRRPLTPGRWTAQLRSVVLDEAGRPAQPSPTTWTVIGAALTPAHNVPDSMQLQQLPLERPQIYPQAGRWSTLLTKDFNGNGFSSVLCSLSAEGSTFCSANLGNTLDSSPEFGPRFLTTTYETLQLHFQQGRCQQGSTNAVLRDAWASNSTAFGVSTECAIAAAQAGGQEPLVALVTTTGQLALYPPTLDSASGSWSFDRASLIPFFSTVADLQLIDAGPERFLFTLTSNEAGDFLPRGHLQRVIAGVPGAELPEPLAVGEGFGTAACALRGQPLLLTPIYTMGPNEFMRPELGATTFDGTVWTRLPALVGIDATSVTCTEVGLVTFVAFTTGGRVRLYYFDGGTWTPILDGTTPDGALTVGPCQGHRPGLAADADSVLVSWYDECPNAAGATTTFLRAKRAR